MIRMQIYLTERQRKELSVLAKSSGRSQADLIREAIDQMLGDERSTRRSDRIRNAAGLWRDRDDLPDARVLRASWERER